MSSPLALAGAKESELNDAMALSLSGDDTKALVWARRATQHPNTAFWAFFSLALVLGHLGIGIV